MGYIEPEHQAVPDPMSPVGPVDTGEERELSPEEEAKIAEERFRQFEEWRKSRTYERAETQRLNEILVAQGLEPTRKNRRAYTRRANKEFARVVKRLNHDHQLQQELREEA